jgi:3-oxoacyl-[acyl-carrier-protein] synthase II
LSRGDLDHVNANGLSTIEDDVREAEAIQTTVGQVPVTAPKSFFGSLGAATGVVELAASLLAFEHGQVPVTLNYRQPDPRCPLAVIRDQPKPLTNDAALILSCSTTGQAAAAVLCRG